MSGIFCKVTHSWQVISYNIKQKSPWQPPSSTHCRFSSHLLLPVRYCPKAGQVEHSQEVLSGWAMGEKWFFLRGSCKPPPKLTTQIHSWWKVHTCSLLLEWIVALFLLKTCIFLLERNCTWRQKSKTVLAAQTLYWRWNNFVSRQLTLQWNPGTLKQSLFHRLARKQLCSSEGQWPTLPGIWISSYVLEASLARDFGKPNTDQHQQNETWVSDAPIRHQNWLCFRISQALPMPWCHYAGRAEQFRRKHFAPSYNIFMSQFLTH